MEPWLATIIIIAVLALLGATVKRVTVFEYEKGLRYRNGRFEGLLDPGLYWYVPFFTLIQKVDVRPQCVTISGQEVLSSDGVTVKVSLAANYQIADSDVAINQQKDCHGALYIELQLALRGIIGGTDIEAVLAGREELSTKLTAAVAPRAEPLGLRLISASLKDIMLPGALKEVFAQVVNARMAGQAALEQARGETAALRSLTNAARLMKEHPNLLQLRLLQAVGESSGNTLVMGVSPGTVPALGTEAGSEKKRSGRVGAAKKRPGRAV